MIYKLIVAAWFAFQFVSQIIAQYLMVKTNEELANNPRRRWKVFVVAILILGSAWLMCVGALHQGGFW
jgi:heme/copper-type cytochrome/quinol oxidase subunit 4